jgi:hypothetical protein
MFADDGSWNGSTNFQGTTANQRYIVMLQPAAGGAPVVGEAFYDDFGNPYRLHEMQRQRNPGVRVAGDKRAGAVNFAAGGSAALMYGHFWLGIDYFNTDGRLNTAWPLYGTGFGSTCNTACSGTPPGTTDSQWVFLQSFSLNPSTLAQTPLDKAQEPIYYPAWTNYAPPELCAAAGLSCANGASASQDVSYFGGDVVALDNGNYVVVVNDYTGFFGGPKGSPAAVAKVFRPDGSTVKGPWLVDPREIWANLAAFQGGFAVRVETLFYFYDDNGNPIATNTVQGSSSIAFDVTRGDYARIASDIRIPYVFLASPVKVSSSTPNVVVLGVWNGQNGAFVTNATVTSDLDPSYSTVDRVNVAADQYGRVCVAFDGVPATDYSLQNQVIARVLQFDGENITYLTPSFFPFISADSTNNITANGILGFLTANPTVAMTADAILIGAKATINSTNNPAGGPDSGAHTDVYTVITSPIPSAKAVGLTNIVPDMLLWYDSNNYYTNGPVNPTEAVANSTIWDAYDSVLGDSAFLVANVTHSSDYGLGIADLCFALAFQPAAGGAPKLGYEFYDDSGNPFRGVISSRQTGPPGRVAADKRYGAYNFITGANCTAGNPAYSGTSFQSNSRFSNAAKYQDGGRYDVTQIFSLNPATLAQTPLTLASDFLGDAPNTAFGDVLCLDNGNFAIIEDDSSKLLLPQEGATAVIVQPNGSVVTPAFAVDSSVSAGTGLWANCAAFSGGFCVRYHATLYFFDDYGNFQGSVPQTSSGLAFNTDRGDTCRLGSDIRSHYVYLAGVAPFPAGGSTPTTGVPVMLAVWNAATLQFVASTTVSSDLPSAQMVVNAVNVGVDALDRVTVAWDCRPNAAFKQYQILARVLQFNGTSFSCLTPTFFPFVNYDPTGLLTTPAQGYLVTQTPGIAMTPRQICISCKGTVNSTNNPAAGVDTPATSSTSGGLDLYTVLSHPAPVAAPRPPITITLSGSSVNLTWPVVDGLFTVQGRNSLASGSWVNLTAQNVPPPVTLSVTNATTFFRLMR